jgi:hypothetical protein
MGVCAMWQVDAGSPGSGGALPYQSLAFSQASLFPSWRTASIRAEDEDEEQRLSFAPLPVFSLRFQV